MNLYAFPLSPADIIRLESIDDLIDRLAWEALAEIRRMADEARAEFAPIKEPMPVPSQSELMNRVRGMLHDPSAQYLGAALAHCGTLGQFGLAQVQRSLDPFRRL